MKLQFFSVNALAPEQDQVLIDDFCSRHRLVSVDKHFVDRGETSYWSVCLTYLDASTSPGKPTQVVNKRGQLDYREVLNEADFAVFAKLRDLRKLTADAEGVPIYAVFTNAQLAEMVTSRVTSQTTLAAINGIGSAKLEKYGKPFLTLLKNTLTTTHNTPADEALPHPAG